MNSGMTMCHNQSKNSWRSGNHISESTSAN